MCNPLGIAGSFVEMMGIEEEGRNLQAKAKSNADMANTLSRDATDRGAIEAQNAQSLGTTTIGTQRAAMAASGVDPSQGTALDVLAHTRYMSELDAATIRNNAAREAWGYQMQRLNIEAKARQDERQTRMRMIAAGVNGMSSLLGGSAVANIPSGSTKSDTQRAGDRAFYE